MKRHFYKLEELKIGMRVNTGDLARIYDTYIVIENLKSIGNGTSDGTIIYISSIQTPEMAEAYYKSTEKYQRCPMIYIHTFQWANTKNHN